MKIPVCLLLCLLCACNPARKEDNIVRVKLLRGPSAIAFAQLMDTSVTVNGKLLQIEVVDSPELIQAHLIKGEAELAVLPMLSAVNLYNKGVNYPLLGCPLWGTLYVVGRDSTSGVLHLFGSGASPDILTRYYLNNHPEWKPELNYTFGSARDLFTGLLSGTVQTAVLSEPFVSMALKKDSTVRLVADLNRPDPDAQGFAQTAIVLSERGMQMQPAFDSLLHASCRFAVEQPDQAIRILEEKGIFAKGMLTESSIHRCRIDYVPACRAKEAVQNLLTIILAYEPKALGGKLPDDTFFLCEH